MSPNTITDSGSFAGTFIHPAILAVIIVSCVLITIINIRYSIFLMIFLSIMIPMHQRFDLFTLNFNILRVLIFAGWIKIIFSKDLTLGKFENTDKAIIYWVIVSVIVFIIQQNNMDAFINRLGFAYNAIGVYFLYRVIIKRKEDVKTVINTLAIVTAAVSIFMIMEQLTGKNFLHVFGTHKYAVVRIGKIRSQGPFAHSINAGVFGAMMFPLYFSMWRHKWGSAFYGIIGTLSASVLVITSASATPLIGAILGLIALLCWPFRSNMRIVSYSILFFAVFIQIIIASPIWALIIKMDLIQGASALHRYKLVDNLIKHFNEWFLVGFSSPWKWGVGMGDSANQYYQEAVRGGILKLALFILIIVLNFNIIGKNIKNTKDVPTQKLFWALGSALFVNVVSFIGISYWDQTVFIWYLFLALITSMCVINGKMHLKLDEKTRQSIIGQRSSVQHQEGV
jgi:hypothetical protein